MTSLKYFCEDAIQWLINAGLVHKVFRIQKFEQPLKVYEDFDCFKLYVNDLGLLGAMALAPASEILVGNSAVSSYKGSFTEQYVEQFENASYQEILKVKNELVSDISKFEHDYDREDPDWNICPKPDVRYQWSLEALGLIAPMLAEAFNREYERGEKGMEDYGGEKREFYGE